MIIILILAAMLLISIAVGTAIYHYYRKRE